MLPVMREEEERAKKLPAFQLDLATYMHIVGHSQRIKNGIFEFRSSQ